MHQIKTQNHRNGENARISEIEHWEYY